MKVGNILDIGIKSDMEFYQKRELRLVNLFALIALIGSVCGIITVFLIKANYPTFIATFSMYTAIGTLLLNYKKYYDAATTLFVITTNFSIFIINQQYAPTVGNQLYYFPIIFCVALIHSPHKPIFRSIIYFAIIAISFLSTIIFRIPSIKNLSVTEEDNKVLLIYNSSFTIFLTIIMVYLVVKLINKQNNETISLLKKEQEAQVIIAHSLKEKETLLAEIQHRVKNNLAVISGLLNLQMEKAPCEVSKNLMIESRNRVMSIAMVHQRLYQKENLSKINFKLYLSELIAEIISSLRLFTKQVKVVEDFIDVELEVTKAIPIGLIINEAVTNSLKHAFKHVETPIITIQMKFVLGNIQITILDNGPGFNDLKNRKENALGLSLIESLADQIDGKILFENKGGASVTLSFQNK